MDGNVTAVQVLSMKIRQTVTITGSEIRKQNRTEFPFIVQNAVSTVT